MALEKGGLADKLGNRYESRWVAKQLLLLLDEKNKSVLIEAIGDDEHGVDIWVETIKGERQAHQCKARNASNEFWSISDLKGRGVLASAKLQLDRDPKYTFWLISHVGSTTFHDICESARNSNDNPEDFYQYQIEKIGKERQEAFSQFCNAIELDKERSTDRAKAFNYLKRVYINKYPDDRNTWEDLLLLSERLLTGKPETHIALLCNYADDNYQYRKPIDIASLTAYLEKQGIYPKNLAYDNRILPAIKELQQQFSESIESGLTIKPLIQRQETQELIKAIHACKSVILHGKAGYGKSGVLYELTNYLHQQNILYLPIRLDRREPQQTATEFGKQLGLPESPAHCLNALTLAEHSCILILDQLDALRWTKAHSEQALDVCKELVRQIEFLWKEGKKITVIICCRSFDLENDSEINKFWLSNNQFFEKIEVKALTPNNVQQVIGSVQLDERQKEILTSVQHLTMWHIIHTSGKTPSFHSSVGLMQAFWKNRYEVLQKAGFSTEKVDQVLIPLIEYAERKQTLSAPQSLVSKYPNCFKALQSYGILQLTDNKVSFCHQSYLDYQIAQRLLEQIHNGKGDILQWLGSREKQSLFRREQLRQVLSLLAEDDSQEWLQVSKNLLQSEKVRFHLKHLVLTLMGQQEKIFQELGNYCLELLKDNQWHKQILETVCLGHASYVQFLIEKGVIKQWLDSQEEQSINESLHLLKWVSEQIPDDVTKVIEPYVEKGENWYRKILSTLCWSIEKDSDQMFKLRLRLIRLNIYPSFLNWKELATQHPLRTIELLEAILSTWYLNENHEIQRKQLLEQWYGEEQNALSTAVKKYPKETWDKLLPHIERLTTTKDYSIWLKRYSHFNPNTAYQLVELTTMAVKIFSKQQPDEFIKSCQVFENSDSQIVQSILIEAFAELPTTHANVGIQWLLADLTRFQLGDGYYESRWQPAVRLVKNLSPHCTEELFRQLENTIYFYFDSDKKIVKRVLENTKEGFFDDYWGRTQYFLLPALCPKRRTSKTNELIVVLSRKFFNYPESIFCYHLWNSEETVDFKLSQSLALDKISDRAWSNIINQHPEVIQRNIDKGNKNSKTNSLIPATERFSHSLERIAKRFPERFGKLALRFPDTVNSSYISAILRAISLIKPDNDIPAEERATWQPASIATVEAVLTRYQFSDDREVASSFCWLITERAEENWSDTSLKRLIHYAQNHPDLEPDKLNIACDQSAQQASVNILFDNTINCVRGVAARAIATLLWHHETYLEELKPTIDHLVHDSHPVVRMAAVETLLPLLNYDKELAIDWFCIACNGDLRVAASQYTTFFLNYTIKSHFSKLAPIIKQMLESPSEEVVRRGTEHVTACWLFHDLFEPELELCKQGSTAQRKGVVKIVSSFIKEQTYVQRCKALLKLFFNDSEKSIQEAVTRGIRHNELFEHPEHHPFILKYIGSLAFKESNIRMFIYQLKDVKGSLLSFQEIIFKTCQQLLNLSLEQNEEKTGFSSELHDSASTLSSILLRLYGQAQDENDSEIIEQCLNMWDRFFEQNIADTRRLLQKVESS